jgi:hypothetical protein
MTARLAVNVASSQRRTNTVARDVAQYEIEVLIIERTNHSEVSANGASRLRKRIDAHAPPHGWHWLEVPLQASRDCEIIFEFLMKRPQSAIRPSQLLAMLNQNHAFSRVRIDYLGRKDFLA